MIAFLADENFDAGIIGGLVLLEPTFDVTTVQEAGLGGATDEVVLAWAADHGLVVLTHDVQTMAGLAYVRVRQGLPMPGVLEVPRRMPLGMAIEQILIAAMCTTADEWANEVKFLPINW